MYVYRIQTNEFSFVRVKKKKKSIMVIYLHTFIRVRTYTACYKSYTVFTSMIEEATLVMLRIHERNVRTD